MTTEKKYIDEYMGHHAIDRVTGFTGIITSMSFDLFGCVQCGVTPPALKDKDGKQELVPSHWFDTNRLVLEGDRVMPLTDFPFFAPASTTATKPKERVTVSGPADKASPR